MVETEEKTVKRKLGSFYTARAPVLPVPRRIAEHLSLTLRPEPENEHRLAAIAAAHEAAHAIVADKYGMVTALKIGRDGSGATDHIRPIGAEYSHEGAMIALAGAVGEGFVSSGCVFGQGFHSDYRYAWRILTPRYPDERARLNAISSLHYEIVLSLDRRVVESLAGHLLENRRLHPVDVRRVVQGNEPSRRSVFLAAMQGRRVE